MGTGVELNRGVAGTNGNDAGRLRAPGTNVGVIDQVGRTGRRSTGKGAVWNFSCFMGIDHKVPEMF